ncbi:MAG: 4Fe-4S dicluster domain-containing protein [bacterium]
MSEIRNEERGARVHEHWRSLDEAARGERDAATDAPPPFAFDRRDFLKLAGVSLAASGLASCARQPLEEILPYVRSPEEIVPGRPLFFATAMPFGGYGSPILVESHMGRPSKIEGNPDHPASRGATDVFAQAAVLALYDPDRSPTIVNRGEISTWSTFVSVFRVALETERETRGAGLRILTETVTSPTLARQLREILAQFPLARWHQHEAVARDGARGGALVAFGEPLETHYRLENADVIVSLDADFLSCGPGAVANARAFAERRRVGRGGAHSADEASDAHRSSNARGMNRLYVVESTPSNTGATADHRLPLRAGQVEAFARELLARLGGDPTLGGAPATSTHAGDSLAPGGLADRWLAAVAKDLAAHRGHSVVIAGEHQPVAVHALAHALNHTLGNIGATVLLTDAIEAAPVDQAASLRELARELADGGVRLLVTLGSNPAYTSPADIDFAGALNKAGMSVHLGAYFDETASRCDWHVPEAHFLEAWSDIRAHDGAASIVQPLIAPLLGGKSAHELLALFGDAPDRTGYEIVRDTWRGAGLGGADFESGWRRAVHDGFIEGTAFAPRTVAFAPSWDRGGTFVAPLAGATSASGAAGLDLLFRADPTIHDGRFANNGWLQELPKALTRLTWENAALIAPATAARLGVESGDVVELSHDGRSLRAPAWVLPGHAEESVTLHLGYGRALAGKVGSGIGANAYALRTSRAPWNAHGLELRNTGRRAKLATTQTHHSMEGRAPVRAGTLAEFEHDPHFAHHGHHEPPRDLTLYPEHPYDGNSWGMVIDLTACTGCSACVVACQAENNIPIVGKENVEMGREMHWIRIDRYYEGDLANPTTYQQPLPCMHCENAPCEVVCPVGATVHSDEGLNDMVYNRCVGTRYCANNCPYKVRRFNFYQYAEQNEPTLKLLANPDVTVRNRGVMEKCTYCVQRINSARITAKNEDRAIRDGDVVTACEAVCPAGAIIFGNINDPASRVSQARKSPLNYGLLADLNTRPRTTYLAAIRNLNPELSADEHGSGSGHSGAQAHS